MNTLYRFYANDGTLLYIGITISPPQRFKQHSRDKAWWNEVARIELVQFNSREELENEEKTRSHGNIPNTTSPIMPPHPKLDDQTPTRGGRAAAAPARHAAAPSSTYGTGSSTSTRTTTHHGAATARFSRQPKSNSTPSARAQAKPSGTCCETETFHSSTPSAKV